MIKGAFLAVTAIVGSCVLSSAEEPMTSDFVRSPIFSLQQVSPRDMVKGHVALQSHGSFAALNNAWHGSGPLTLVRPQFFSFPSAFGWLEGGADDLLPVFIPGHVIGVTPLFAPVSEPASKVFGLLPNPDYVGGEVGLFYGRSTGKHRLEVEQAYILGEIIDGNTHINVGASYERASGR